MIIFIFGDSITQGLWDSRGGWADRVKAFVYGEGLKVGMKNYHEAYNLGVDGNTTKLVLNRFESETTARLWPGETYAFIFAVGINDTLHRNNEDYRSTPERYASELKQLTTLARKFSDKIAFIGLTPVDETLTNPLKYSTGEEKCYTNERIQRFNDVLNSFARDERVPLIEVYREFAAQDFKNLLCDGVHPNDEGHELIYDLVLPQIKAWMR